MTANSMILMTLASCHGRGRGFEPRRPRHISQLKSRLYGTSDRKTGKKRGAKKGHELEITVARPATADTLTALRYPQIALGTPEPFPFPSLARIPDDLWVIRTINNS
jgi:hypothetical protein